MTQKQQIVIKKKKMFGINQMSATTNSDTAEQFDPYLIIKAPFSTEKAIKSVESDNKLTFIVNPNAGKADVKRAVEEMFKVSVVKVNIQNAISGQKKASVKIGAGKLASDISADLGLI